MKHLMKRGFAVMMALALCLSLLPVNVFAAEYKCPKCNGTSIKVDYDGDYAICIDCEYEGKPTDFEALEKSDPCAKGHKFNNSGNCTECGFQCKHESINLDTGKCNICGMEKAPLPVEPPKHDCAVDGHVFEGKSCKYCGYWEHTEHQVGQFWTNNFNGTHSNKCTIPGCDEVVTENCTVDKEMGFCLSCGYQPDGGSGNEPSEDSCLFKNWIPNDDGGTYDNPAGTHYAYCVNTAWDHNCPYYSNGYKKTEACDYVKTDTGMVCKVCQRILSPVTLGPGTGDNTCKDGEHEFGNVGQNVDQYSHILTCMKCGMKKQESCKQGMLTSADGKPMAHYCTVCGRMTNIEGDGYCIAGMDHDWATKQEVLSEDGQSVLTTLTCKNCGDIKITDICNSPAKVTVHYQYKDGTKAAEDKSQAVFTGSDYKIESPEIKGYEPDQTVVSGTCTDGKGLEVTVTYNKADPTLTIHYHYLDGPKAGKEVAKDYTAKVEAGKGYEVKSPAAPLGYDIEQGREIVKGTMGAGDTEETVKYSLHTYTWTIKYVDEKDNELSNATVIPYTVENVNELKAPDTTPKVVGYQVKETKLNNPDPSKLGDVVGKVVYEPTVYTMVVNYVDAATGDVLDSRDLGTTQINGTYTIEALTFEGYYQMDGQTLTGTVTEDMILAAEANNNQIVLKVTYTKVDTHVVRWVNWNGAVLETGSFNEGEDAPAAITYSGAEPTRPSDGTYTYTFRGWSAPEVSEDGTVTYTALFNATLIRTPNPNPDPDPEPPYVPPTTPDPEPVVIDEPDVPLVEEPVLPEPPEEPIVVDEPEIPLVELPEEVEIEDPAVPLAEVPQTGDASVVWLAAAALPACGLGLIFSLKKREGEED